MEVPKFTDLELFLLSGWISYIIIRFVADSVRLSLYVDFKHWRVRVGRPPKGSLAGTLRGFASIHHFVYGMILMPFTFVAIYWRLWFSPILVGVVMALIFSEIKELAFMTWGKVS